ncbi:hypothetical protein HB852_15440 [Listeria grandensis]|uniref:hypothetical protein n=1 Tax=Listeria grandensis TaxID=1494963 RepID=UPI001629A2C4|nr:hypothetical protein [Listeria grandensis]MBC1476010.1 hypothetical protein [Listeria grandensis]
MLKLDESYFYKLRKVVFDRLNPGGVVIYLVGLWMFSLVMLGLATWILQLAKKNIIVSDFINSVYLIFVTLFLILFVYLIMCIFSERFLYKTQKVASLCMVLYTIIMSVEPLFLCYLFSLDGTWGSGFGNWIVISVSIGLIQLGLYFIFVWRGVVQGSLKADGHGLFTNNNTQKLIKVNIISYVCLVVWLFFIVGLSSKIIGPIVFLFLCFALTAAVQEFIILTICKYRFRSFDISYEEGTKYRMKKSKRS